MNPNQDQLQDQPPWQTGQSVPPQDQQPTQPAPSQYQQPLQASYPAVPVQDLRPRNIYAAPIVSVAPITPPAQAYQPQPAPINPYQQYEQYQPGQQPVYAAQPLFQSQGAQSFGPPPRSRRKRGPIIALAIFGCLLILGAFTYALVKPVASPSTVFRDSLITSLSTTSVTQNTDDGVDKLVTKFDVSRPKDARVDSIDTIAYGGKTIANVEGYGTMTDTYAKITESSGAPDSALNQWIQLRNKGTLPADVNEDDTLYPAYDPRYCLLGQYIFGNLSVTDRTALVNYIVQNDVYKYDTAKVTSTKLNGVAVYKYDVSLQHMDVLTEKAAKLFGITDKDAIAEASASSSKTKATMYIAKGSHQLIKVTTGSLTVTYGSYGSTALPKQPKADIQYSAFAALGSDSTDSGTSTNSDSAADFTRKSDIRTIQQALESYYAANDNYPTLAEMNDSAWMSQNMPDVGPSILKDPSGTSSSLAAEPVTGQYSYQVSADSDHATDCISDETNCQYYILTVTLSNGNVYSADDAFDS